MKLKRLYEQEKHQIAKIDSSKDNKGKNSKKIKRIVKYKDLARELTYL